MADIEEQCLASVSCEWAEKKGCLQQFLSFRKTQSSIIEFEINYLNKNSTFGPDQFSRGQAVGRSSEQKVYVKWLLNLSQIADNNLKSLMMERTTC